jgi:hypothetical protein
MVSSSSQLFEPVSSPFAEFVVNRSWHDVSMHVRRLLGAEYLGFSGRGLACSFPTTIICSAFKIRDACLSSKSKIRRVLIGRCLKFSATSQGCSHHTSTIDGTRSLPSRHSRWI